MTVPEPYVTPEEYLERERAAETRSEYYRGRVYAMTGASRQHGRIVYNLAGILSRQLSRSACDVYLSEMRVKVRRNGLYTYPDVVALCGEPTFEDAQLDTLVNPTLIVEVLSPSTTAYDRGEKFALYRELETLRDYVLVAQDQPRVERFQREGDRWALTEAVGLDASMAVPSVGATLPLRDLYARVEWPDNPPLRVIRETAGVG
ncbi:MAG: Uma2 family endonuclease [Gemmatirosa sp.]